MADLPQENEYPTSQATITHTNRHEYTLVYFVPTHEYTLMDYVPLQILRTLPNHLLLLVGNSIQTKWQVASPDRLLVGAQTIYNHHAWHVPQTSTSS